ncbi:MAG: ribonuclease P protein component [Rhodobacteraceae bacterium]|nr:ribonuclease P protein component [Paracoccaceae bacterium]OUU62517.1 MAG: ribonuclease P protein component [Alphaproteobacteria bacterium TMED62]|tara:strand:+ start:160 stop:510 length:351 start_codon:yes stop_codon:yes gene_type:complete
MKTHKITKKKEFSYIFKNGNFINFNSFTINYAEKLTHENNPSPRYGIIASKKIGNAVKRNFAKRRVKALKNILNHSGKKELDYVLIIKKKLLNTKFKALSIELEMALEKIKKKNNE